MLQVFQTILCSLVFYQEVLKSDDLLCMLFGFLCLGDDMSSYVILSKFFSYFE